VPPSPLSWCSARCSSRPAAAPRLEGDDPVRTCLFRAGQVELGISELVANDNLRAEACPRRRTRAGFVPT
jgi:hypothetical protein